MDATRLRPAMVAYLPRRPGAAPAGWAILHDYATTYADRHGYHLAEIIPSHAGAGDEGDHAPGDVLAAVHRHGARAVLLTGPAAHVLAVLVRRNGIRIITLADALCR